MDFDGLGDVTMASIISKKDWEICPPSEEVKLSGVTGDELRNLLYDR